MWYFIVYTYVIHHRAMQQHVLSRSVSQQSAWHGWCDPNSNACLNDQRSPLEMIIVIMIITI